jgi:hypothetical protein
VRTIAKIKPAKDDEYINRTLGRNRSRTQIHICRRSIPILDEGVKRIQII